MARPKGSKDSKKRQPRNCPVTSQMIGNKFNRLFVKSIEEKGRQVRINVICDCGTKKDVSAKDVLYGNIQSCGCLHREKLIQRQIKPNNIAAKTRLFNSYRKGAEVRELKFELSNSEVFELSIQSCYYCEDKPSRSIKTIGGEILVNGIDRVDNDIGYVLTNCVPCCSKCNLAKRAVTKNIIIKSYEFFKKL